MFMYQRIIALTLLLVLAIFLTGCFTIKVGGEAQLAPSNQPGTLVAEKRFWYALYGLIPLGDNSTDKYIPPTVNKVRVETKYKVSDFFINIFTGLITIETFSVEIYEVK